MAGPEVKPVYVLHGDDAYLLDSNRRGLIEQIIGGADPQLCVSNFEATAELGEVLVSLRTLPFLASRRAVVVRDADAFIAANRAALEEYLEKPCATASLILVVLSWLPKTNLGKRVNKIGLAIDCSLDPKENLTGWVVAEAAKRQKKIDRQTADALVETVGRDYASLQNEIEKLSVYVGSRPAITVADVSAVTASTAGPADFALTNALTAGKAPDALAALGDLLTKRGEEFKVLGSVASHLRKVMKMQEAVQAGRNPESTLFRRPPPQVMRDYLSLLKRRPMPKLQKDFSRLIAADLAMKSGADPVAAMQQLVVELVL